MLHVVRRNNRLRTLQAGLRQVDTALHDVLIFSRLIRVAKRFRKQLHLGVIRDFERRERRKAENVYILQQQAELAKELRRKQALRENDT